MSSHRPSLHVVKTENLPIMDQLVLEEALLRADDRNWFLWNHGSPPAVVMGISGIIQQLINRSEWEAQRLPLIRRFSGGGTVVVDETTLFASWIVNHQAMPQIPAQPTAILHWVGGLLAALGIEIAEQDFVIGSQKIGGNAQYLRRDRWLHHTSFLWDYRLDRMALLQLPQKRPGYRGMRSHGEFCRRLKGHLHHPDDLFHHLLGELAQAFELVYVPLEEAIKLCTLPHRKTVQSENWPV